MKKLILFLIMLFALLTSFITVYLSINLLKSLTDNYYVLLSPILFMIIFIVTNLLILNLAILPFIKEGNFHKNSDPLSNYLYIKIIDLCFQPFNFIIPIIFMSIFVKLLGSKLGKSTIVGWSVIEMPTLLQTGSNCVIGGYSVLKAKHELKETLEYKKIILEDNVTIGANSVIEPGVIVKKGSIVAPGSFVEKDKVIPENQLWGGVPAKFIKKLS